MEVFGKVDKALLNVARQRLNAAFKQAGMVGGTASGAASGANPAELLQAQNNRLVAAGLEMQRQAQQEPRASPKKLPWQAEDAYDTGGGGASGSGDGQPLSMRKAKKQNWWNDIKQQWRRPRSEEAEALR